MGRIFIE